MHNIFVRFKTTFVARKDPQVNNFGLFMDMTLFYFYFVTYFILNIMEPFVPCLGQIGSLQIIYMHILSWHRGSTLWFLMTR